MTFPPNNLPNYCTFAQCHLEKAKRFVDPLEFGPWRIEYLRCCQNTRTGNMTVLKDGVSLYKIHFQHTFEGAVFMFS